MKRQYCPRCKSKNIKSDLSASNAFGMGSSDQKICQECGFTGVFFPEED